MVPLTLTLGFNKRLQRGDWEPACAGPLCFLALVWLSLQGPLSSLTSQAYKEHNSPGKCHRVDPVVEELVAFAQASSPPLISDSFSAKWN